MKERFCNIFKPAAAAAVLIAASLLGSCSKTLDSDYYIPSQSIRNNSGLERIPSPDTRHTFILFSLGHNNLANSLKEDIEEIKRGFLPAGKRTDNAFLVFSHNASHEGYWSAPSEPVLMRIYRKTSGEIVTDTLKVWSNTTISASAATIREVFEIVQKEFPSASYGALFSSHATGYLPAGFYLNPDSIFYYSDTYIEQPDTYKENTDTFHKRQKQDTSFPVPYTEPDYPSDWPLVKSFGQDVSNRLSYEIDIMDLAEAIPMKLSYILFDSCLMGGIEVAYELKDKCDKIGFSQAEVLADGFVYTSLGNHLLKGDPHPEAICEDYFNSYDIRSGVYRSATISCISSQGLDALADVCRKLFDKYRSTIYGLPPYNIQKYFRENHHWFYDLESIIDNIGAEPQEMEEFRQALDGCTIYKAATPSFMLGAGGFEVNTFSGLSMYLPSDGHKGLDKYYQKLKWNKATELIL